MVLRSALCALPYAERSDKGRTEIVDSRSKLENELCNGKGFYADIRILVCCCNKFWNNWCGLSHCTGLYGEYRIHSFWPYTSDARQRGAVRFRDTGPVGGRLLLHTPTVANRTLQSETRRLLGYFLEYHRSSRHHRGFRRTHPGPRICGITLDR